MKKFFLLILVLLLILVSCSGSDYICYYGYFTNSAFLLVYSSHKNTLYKIDIPVDVIVEWGLKEEIETVPDTLRNFVGLEDSGFMIGTDETMKGLREICDALSNSETKDALSRLQAISEKSKYLDQENFLLNINRLCGCDVSNLIRTLKNKNASVAYMDASVVLDKNNIEEAKSCFKTWINQIIF